MVDDKLFPTYNEIHIPLLRELEQRGGSARPSDLDSRNRTIYDALADHLGLPDEARETEIFEGDGVPRSKWKNMVRWARNDLKKRGYLSSPEWGVWAITEKGREYLAQSKKI